MFALVWKTAFIYFLILLTLRFMGKREVGQLGLFDFVVLLLIADVSAITLDDEKRPKDRCPCEEYFLICEDDDSLVGMINLRWNLNENLLMHGGHIGYSIRPTKRRLGYNKINLYLCLLKAQEKNIKKVLLTAYKDNIGSVKTILALGGKLENEIETEKGILGRYWISVDEEIEKIKKERGDLFEQSN